jgi:hypothetical protein
MDCTVWEFEFWQHQQIFVLHNLQTCPVVQPTSYLMGTGVFSQAVKRPRHEVGHSPPSRAEIKKEWGNTSTPPPLVHMPLWRRKGKFYLYIANTELAEVKCVHPGQEWDESRILVKKAIDIRVQQNSEELSASQVWLLSINQSAAFLSSQPLWSSKRRTTGCDTLQSLRKCCHDSFHSKITETNVLLLLQFQAVITQHYVHLNVSRS